MPGPTPARLARMRAVAAGRTRRLVLALEDVHKARNLGALLRTCDALGLQEIHAIENRSPADEDGETSMGAGRWLEVVRHRRDGFPDPSRLHPPAVAREPAALDNSRRALASLRARGYRLAVADLGAGALPVEEVPVDRPLAVVIGNEFTGASPVALEMADLRFGLPMRGFAQSLNLAVFAGIALHALAARMRPLPGWALSDEAQADLVRRWTEAQA
jgi:tRNA (guanosine-2'-O-)-methyltransferase